MHGEGEDADLNSVVIVRSELPHLLADTPFENIYNFDATGNSALKNSVLLHLQWLIVVVIVVVTVVVIVVVFVVISDIAACVDDIAIIIVDVVIVVAGDVSNATSSDVEVVVV
jgi:hypothetical protein